MIVDHISNLALYQTMNKNIDSVIDFIKNNDLLKLPSGKTVINESVYVLRESYDPRPLESCYFEGHKKYLDIQLVLSGKEAIGYHYKDSSSDIVVTDHYDDVKDVEKYQINHFTEVILTKGMFAYVEPRDLHMPKLKVKDSEFVEKIVFKVKV